MREKVVEILSEALADAVFWICSPKSEMEKVKKEFGFKLEKENKNFEKEYFYLMMFLSMLACQMVFKADRRLIKEVLDAFHRHIMEKRFKLPAEILKMQAEETKLNNRYQQYRKLLKTKRSNFDLDFFTQQVK